MMDELDPYEQIGVPRDADTPTIRKAYRRKAKTDHPNAGGDEAEWAKTSRSLVVLTDPKKRRTFDDTGRIEEDRPDNDRAAALQMVEVHVGELVNAFISSGFAPAKDPRSFDMPVVIADILRQENGQALAGIVGGEKVVAYLKDVARRFRLKNPDAHPEGDPIARGFKRQIENAEEQIANIRMSMRQRDLAIAIVADYSFKMDEPQWTFPDHIDMGGRGLWPSRSGTFTG